MALHGWIDVTGANLEHLLVRFDDLINVYAYVNEETAIGFDARTGLGGRFSVKIASEVESESPTESEVLICRSSSRYGTGLRHLPYEEGHYVSVCNWDETRLGHTASTTRPSLWPHSTSKLSIILSGNDTKTSFGNEVKHCNNRKFVQSVHIQTHMVL